MGFMTNMKAQKALMAHNKGDADEAKRLYEEAYAEGMDKARYLLPYSILLLRRGEYEKARDVLKKAEKAPGGLQPDQRSQLLTNYAVASWKLGRIDYAVDLLREVYRKGPSGANYGTLGYLLIEQGNFEEALAFNEEAVKYDDEDPIALDNMGQTYYRLAGDKVEAKKWFDRAIKEKEEAIDTNYFLAQYEIEEGKKDEAKERLEKILNGKFSPLNYATPERIQEALDSIK